MFTKQLVTQYKVKYFQLPKVRNRLLDMDRSYQLLLNAVCQGSSDAVMKNRFLNGSSCFRRHISDWKTS